MQTKTGFDTLAKKKAVTSLGKVGKAGKNKLLKSNMDFYKNRSALNLVMVAIAIIIGSASIIYTNDLVKKLQSRERRLIELYAKTLEYTVNEQNATDITFVIQEILLPNNSIPLILTDGIGRPLESKNIQLDPAASEQEQQLKLRQELDYMRNQHEPIMITFRDEEGQIYDYNYVYYKNSDLLINLEFYPYIQLTVISIFFLLVYFTFSYSKSAEQNRLWVGLAKETAHQLGTPISSLMAWIEYFKADDQLKDSEVIGELEKDIQRLEMITNRFSSIGSVPILNSENLAAVVNDTVGYLRRRLSKKVEINVNAFPIDIRASISKPLFEWVIENLCKNAVDSMGGIGRIDISLRKGADDTVIIDVSDTGKGIPKNRLKKVFTPGYTTKTRGWGLGLTLVKRIIERYHKGKIYIKESEVDKGTTFRILLIS
jgi:two-component system, sporulation sensor kinase E